MANLMKYLPLVKGQAEFHMAQAVRFGEQSKHPALARAEKHANTGNEFLGLLAEMQQATAELEQAGKPGVRKATPLALSFDELEGLPQELLQELSFSDGDRTDYTIIRMIEDLGGVASLDRIIVGLYKQTGEITKRTALTSRLYRMAQKGSVFPVPNKKGVYATQELNEDELERLFAPK